MNEDNDSASMLSIEHSVFDRYSDRESIISQSSIEFPGFAQELAAEILSNRALITFDTPTLEAQKRFLRRYMQQASETVLRRS